MIARGLWQTSLSVQVARELAVRARRSCLRVNPTRCLGAFPEILLPRPSELVGRRKYRTRCDCQFARHISLHRNPFQLVFEPSKCPSASTETSVRSRKTIVRSKKKKKKKKKKKNSKLFLTDVSLMLMFFYLCVYLLVLGFSILFYLFIYFFFCPRLCPRTWMLCQCQIVQVCVFLVCLQLHASNKVGF